MSDRECPLILRLGFEEWDDKIPAICRQHCAGRWDRAVGITQGFDDQQCTDACELADVENDGAALYAVNGLVRVYTTFDRCQNCGDQTSATAKMFYCKIAQESDNS